MTTHEASGRADAAVLREAVRADLLAVTRIERAAFRQPWPVDAFESHLDAPAFFVAEDPGQTGVVDERAVVGYVVADVVPNHGRPVGHVKDLAVHPDRRGEGLGRRLLERALSVLAGGVTAVKLEVRPSNEAAHSLYRSAGFEYRSTVPGYYDDGEDAAVLVWHPSESE